MARRPDRSTLPGEATRKKAPGLPGTFCVPGSRACSLCLHREDARAQLVEATAGPVALRRSRNGLRLSPAQHLEVIADLELQHLAILDNLAAVDENVLDGPVIGDRKSVV